MSNTPKRPYILGVHFRLFETVADQPGRIVAEGFTPALLDARS